MPAARPRTRQPEVRPDQILDAAQALLLSNGPMGTTMDAVADAAGIGKGTIYHYYSSKAELLSAVEDLDAATVADDSVVLVSGSVDGDLLGKIERAAVPEDQRALLVPLRLTLEGARFIQNFESSLGAQPRHAAG